MEKFKGVFKWQDNSLPFQGKSGEQFLSTPGCEISWQSSSDNVIHVHQPGWTIFKWGSIRDRKKIQTQHSIIEKLSEALLTGESPEAFLKDTEGEFSLLIWNEADRRLYLATDPVGMMKLYFGRFAAGVVVSSHVSEVACHCGLSDYSPEGMSLLFSLKGIPAPHTVIKGISVLKPAQMLEIWSNDEKSIEYWPILEHIREPFCGNFDHAQADLLSLLEESISRIVGSGDEPLGVSLSGGVDSALILGLAKKMKIPTLAYTVGYNPSTSTDESKIARQSAEAIGTNIEVLCPKDIELADLLDKAIISMPEPIGDATILPHLYLTNRAKDTVKNILDGTGADNVFGGLQKFSAEALVKKYLQIPYFLRHGFLLPLSHALPSSRHSKFSNWTRKAQKFSYGAELPERERKVFWSRFMSQEQVAHIFDPEWENSSRLAEEINDYLRKEASTYNDDLLVSTYVSIRSTLPTYAIQKLMTIRYIAGVNYHMPYISQDMIEFSLGLPSYFKIQNHRSKIVLRAAAGKILPEICLSQRKVNFSPPIGRWLAGVFREELLDTLRFDGPFNRSLIEKMTAQQFTGKQDWQWELWLVFIFLKWWRMQIYNG